METGFDEKKLKIELNNLQNMFDFTELGFNEAELLRLQNINDEFYKQLLQIQIKKMVRNEFRTVGPLEFPLIRREEIDLSKIKLYSYGNAKYNDKLNKNKTIHFFLHDYKFECIYENAEYSIEKLRQYYAVLSPDFSLYMDMPIVIQMYNAFRNRWSGAYMQSLGLKVIPTISWSDERSFSFCFEGVEKGSIVAVSTHGNRKVKEEFLAGYQKMLEIIEPSAIICYGKPFPEMAGNLLVFPYNRHEYNEVKL